MPFVEDAYTQILDAGVECVDHPDQQDDRFASAREAAARFDYFQVIPRDTCEAMIEYEAREGDAASVVQDLLDRGCMRMASLLLNCKFPVPSDGSLHDFFVRVDRGEVKGDKEGVDLLLESLINVFTWRYLDEWAQEDEVDEEEDEDGASSRVGREGVGTDGVELEERGDGDAGSGDDAHPLLE